MFASIDLSSPRVLLGLSVFLLSCGSYKFLLRCRKGPLPPGPKPRPVVGNLLHLPKHNEWETYAKWAKEYGSIMSLHLGVLGSPMIIINSLDVAKTLMNGRSAIYAGRPYSGQSHLDGTDFFLTSKSGEPHRVRRAAAQRYYSGGQAKKHQHVQQQEAHDLLRVIEATPGDLCNHLKRFAANVVLLSTYGYRVQESSDPVLARLEEGIHLAEKSIGLMALLLNAFPFLQHYPTWLPFSGFRRTCASMRKLILASLRDEPFEKSKDLMAEGKIVPCFVSTSLDNIGAARDEDQELIIRDCAGVMYGAGVESTMATMSTFCLAATLYPSFYEQAQRELDTVIGRDRLPTIQDFPQLPFAEAVVLELLRWHVVTPLGLPHAAVRDDFYDGMFIPEGAMVAVNEWVIMRDPTIFPDPHSFDPNRFIGQGSEHRRDVVSTVWGWGRRACPGRQLAETSLFIAIASIMAVFDILPTKDADGKPVPVTAEFTSGAVRYPLPFECSVTPRSRHAVGLIESSTQFV